MSKKSLINRLYSKKLIVESLRARRKMLLNVLTKNLNARDFQKINKLVQKIKKNSSKTRVRVICWHTGRISGSTKFFGLSRLSLRDLGHRLVLPYINKASW